LDQKKIDPETGRSQNPTEVGGLQEVVSEPRKNSLLFVAERKQEKISSMPPRRRDRKMLDPAVEREMCELRARIDAMETAQRCTVDAGDISEDEVKMKLEMKEKKLQSKMLRKNAYSGLLQE
jgi:hypothetical protein